MPADEFYDDPSSERTAKAVMIGCAILFGAFIGDVASPPILWGIIAGVAAGLLYPVIAALAVMACEALREWAYEGEPANWKRIRRFWLGAIWPLSATGLCITYLFLGIINRSFSDFE